MTYNKFKEIVLDKFNNYGDMATFSLLDLNQVIVEIDRQLEHLEELIRLNGDKG